MFPAQLRHKPTEPTRVATIEKKIAVSQVHAARQSMEMKLSSSGELLGASAGCKKRPPSRLQKHAPASLQLEPAPGGQALPASWGDGRTPIPLLSPLIVSPAPAWEADQAASRREGVQGGAGQAEGRGGGECVSAARHGAHGGSSGECQVDDAAKAPAPSPGGVWRHPALPTPVAEPASLVPFFQSQCALEERNAQAQQ